MSNRDFWCAVNLEPRIICSPSLTNFLGPGSAIYFTKEIMPAPIRVPTQSKTNYFAHPPKASLFVRGEELESPAYPTSRGRSNS